MAYTKWNERKIRQQMRYLKRRYDFTKDERFKEFWAHRNDANYNT